MNVDKFYGVYIEKRRDSDEPENSVHVYMSYEEAKKVIKENQNARFKLFNSKEEAIYFSINGSASGPGCPDVPKSGISFSTPKSPEIYLFRTSIENDDLKSVKYFIWTNPRYLISSVDTPTIMRSGARYNALHIAAMHNSFKVVDYILKTMMDQEFIQLMDGVSSDSSYLHRSEALLNMYLNTPDKALNQTPLHFASSHGSVEVIEILIKYPQLKLNVKNKHNKTAKDLVCTLFRAKSSNKTWTADEKKGCADKIQKLLVDNPFFVPIWRSNDDAVQPIIGKPYSPKSPPVCPLVTSPLSPNMEIKAIAGPMSFNEASNFHRNWKSPVKSMASNTPHISKGVLLRSPLYSEKSHEKVGRILAKQFHISWTEYWPFLNAHVNLSSEAGLQLLEDYLKNVIVTTTTENEKNIFVMNTPMSDLCNAFSRFSITNSRGKLQNYVHERGDSPSLSSPYLSMDNLCSTFARNILTEFENFFYKKVPKEDYLAVMIKKIRNLSGTINSCAIDSAFENFPFEKIHARVAYWIQASLNPSNISFLHYVAAIFQFVNDTDNYDITSCISISPSSLNIELNSIVQTLKCINTRVIELLKVEEIKENNTQYSKDWLSMSCCSCFENNRIKNNGDHTRNFKRPSRKLFNESPSTEKIDFKISDADVREEVTNEDESDCDSNVKVRSLKLDIDDSDSDGEFITPSNSIYNSEEEMESPDEGPDIFIYDNRGTSMDNAVLEAIADVDIDQNKYPSIYRWKHSILLQNLKRFSWPSPKVELPKNREKHGINMV